MVDRANRHPADQLSDVRSRIRELEQEESELRSYLLRHPDDLVGSEYVALVSPRSHKSVDMESLRREVRGDPPSHHHRDEAKWLFVPRFQPHKVDGYGIGRRALRSSLAS